MGLPWYKRDVDAWRGGTRGMSLELRGFYSELLDAMWDRQAPIPNDESKIAMMVGCNKRTVRKLLPQLVALGKVVETADGLSNARMAREIEDVQPDNSKRIRPEFDLNSKRIRPEFERKNPKNPMFSTRVLEVEEEVDKESPPCSPSREPEAAPSKQARPTPKPAPETKAKTGDIDAGFEAWARVASDYGLPACKSVSEARRKRMAKRLKVAGGPEAFEAVLRKEIAGSGFLRGRKAPKPGHKPFKADVDFVLQDASWDRIVDGFYADAPGTPPAVPTGSSGAGAARGALPEVYVDPQAEDAACAGMTLEEYRAVIERARAAGKIRKTHPVHNAGQYRLDCSEQIGDASKSHGGRHEDAC